MKKVTLSLVFAVGALLNASAQIYVNTGNPNVQKAVKKEPNVPVVNLDKNVNPTEAAKNNQQAAKKVISTDIPNDLPPNTESGKCYARITIPAKYETVEERVIDRPASFRTEIIPATYKTVQDSILVKPAGVRKVTIAAVYETVTEDVLVTPATKKWVNVTDPACMLPNPADCQILQLKDIPAVYKTVTRQVEKTPSSVKEIPVPASYNVVNRRVMDLPAETRRIEIPATYKIVTRQRLVKEAGYSEWQEVLCGKDFTPEKIKAIQEALVREGFSNGPADGVLGSRTKAALISYQQAYNLPVGNLNFVTLKHLKVN